jgi:hypothetical protein
VALAAPVVDAHSELAYAGGRLVKPLHWRHQL